jgi:UPF0176 protein
VKHTILLYYKYTNLKEPHDEMIRQRAWCEALNLKGRIIIASEGINGTLEGTTNNTQKYIELMNSDRKFNNINWKKSVGTGTAFKKLSVKVRPEIVTTGIPDKDFGPLNKRTGKYLSAKELRRWYDEGREFYVIDMRNDYEFEIGRFKNSIWPDGLGHFRDVAKTIKSIINLKNKTIVTVCTGGVRCETASGLLQKYGFSDVYQLEHGIVTFMEKYPNTYFEGKLLVFDGRETMGFNVDDPKHKIVGKCRNCGKKSENLVNYYENEKNKYGILCEKCCKSGKIELQRVPTSQLKKLMT